jgi:outer membrane PBP1 activator LpoA protein
MKINKGRLSMHSNLRGFAKALVVLAPAIVFAGCATLSDEDKATLSKASSDAASAQSTAASAQSAAQAAAQQAQQAADAAKAAQAAAEQAAAEARAASEKAEQVFNQRLKK